MVNLTRGEGRGGGGNALVSRGKGRTFETRGARNLAVTFINFTVPASSYSAVHNMIDKNTTRGE